MSSDEELEVVLSVMEKERIISETQIREVAQLLADYEGERFVKLEYK